jgi:hypothetical protein
MPTGSKSLLLNQKQLLGFQDLGLRGFTALRNSHIEATKARWDVDGVFNTKLSAAGSAPSTIQIIGASKSTDGLGHVLDISSAYQQSATFQNSNAIPYYIGMMYAELPAGIRINPLTGKPQFDSYVEEIGFKAVPDSVVDNGNGTITMVIDSATESGVTNAGRLVRVWKATPADGASTFAIALEETTSIFAGGQNKIITAAKFGQTTISTVASDYFVTVMGPRVSRNTDLSGVSGVVFVGVVTGNAGTPVIFSNANQTLLKTFQDATQVTYFPAGWLSPGATNVQLALDAIVSGLGDNLSSATSGASKIGVYPSDLSTIAAGGLGNVIDSTYTTSANVKDLLLGIDAMARRRQTFQTKNDGVGQIGDWPNSDGQNLANQISSGRPQWLRTLSNSASTPYLISNDVPVGSGQSSYFIGEYSDPTQAQPHLRKTRITTNAANRRVSLGKWQRLWLDASSATSFKFGGANNRWGGILEDFGANGGGMNVEPNTSPATLDGPMNWRNGLIIPKDEANKACPSSVYFGYTTSGTAGWVWVTLEKLLIYGNSPTQTGTKTGALQFSTDIDATYLAATAATQGRPIVIRDCVFVTQDPAQAGLVSIDGTAHVTFENCRFFDISGRTGSQPTIGINNTGNAQVTFKNCVVFSPEGCALASSNVIGGLFENCSFICGIGGTISVATPQAILLSSDQKYGVTMRDCRVFYGTSMFRTTAPASSVPLFSVSGMMFTISNLNIKVDPSQATLGYARLVDIQCTGNNPGQGAHAIVDGLTIDCGGAKHNDGATQGPIRFTGFASSGTNSGRLTVNNLLVRNTQINAAASHNDNPLVQCDTLVSGWNWLLCCSNSAATRTIAAIVKVAGNANILRDMKLAKALYSSAMATATFWIVGDNNTIDGITADDTCANSGGSAILVKITGNENKLKNVDVSMGSDQSGIANITGRDNEVSSCVTHSIADTAYPFAFIGGGNRRNKFLGNTVHWNGTTWVGVAMFSTDSIVDDCCFYRSVGAVNAIANAAAGSLTGTCIVTSTTL